jgi:hypothetical protein
MVGFTAATRSLCKPAASIKTSFELLEAISQFHVGLRDGFQSRNGLIPPAFGREAAALTAKSNRSMSGCP